MSTEDTGETAPETSTPGIAVTVTTQNGEVTTLIHRFEADAEKKWDAFEAKVRELIAAAKARL
jgi:hypothetical protein